MSIKNGDTLGNDWPEDPENPNEGVQFDAVVMNPPYSAANWNKAGLKVSDPRFEIGGALPPDSKGDYAFISHMIHSLAEGGRMAVVLPHGVLFRGASEGRIRQNLIDMNLLDAVIGLPSNLFFGTGIPACVLVFKQNRGRDEILFIDASGDDKYEKGKNQNKLREGDIQRIVDAYETYKTEDKFSYVAKKKEVIENDYNLNIPRYVDTFEEEDMVDMTKVSENIKEIKAELSEVEAQMAKILGELGL